MAKLTTSCLSAVMCVKMGHWLCHGKLSWGCRQAQAALRRQQRDQLLPTSNHADTVKS